MAGISSKPSKGHDRPGAVEVRTRCGLHTDASVLAATTDNGKAGVWTKTSGTGRYLYTLNTEYKVNGAGMTCAGLATVSWKAAAAADITAELESEDYSTGTLVVRTVKKSDGTAVETAAAAAINVAITIFDSSVT